MQKYTIQKYKKKEQDFFNNLEKLFDIAHGNIFEMIDDETKKFLIDQRTERIFHLDFAEINDEQSQEAGKYN